MKIAIFHDFFGTIGGGEKLVLEIAKNLDVDIITTDFNKENIKKINGQNINFINLGKPISFPILKQIHASYKFKKANFPNYDFYILSGNWSVFASKKHKPNLWFCHTPVRMFYDSYHHFKKQCPFLLRPLFSLWVLIHKHYVEKSLKDVNKIVVNSKNCRERVKKAYKINPLVIYAPIKKYNFKKYGNFWLSVNRIYPHKRLELQIETFRKIPEEKLYIVGGVTKGDNSVRYLKRILKTLPENAKYLGEISEEKLAELYGTCKGFITTAIDEDFGMTPLEAMSAGKAVVAVNEGGYKETIINKKTGLLVNTDIGSLVNAVRYISKNPKQYKNNCIKQARKFNVKIFIDKIKENVHTTNQAINNKRL